MVSVCLWLRLLTSAQLTGLPFVGVGSANTDRLGAAVSLQAGRLYEQDAWFYIWGRSLRALILSHPPFGALRSFIIFYCVFGGGSFCGLGPPDLPLARLAADTWVSYFVVRSRPLWVRARGCGQAGRSVGQRGCAFSSRQVVNFSSIHQG